MVQINFNDFVLISLGSNLGNREFFLEKAIDELRLLPGINIIKKSSQLETKPLLYTNQPNFINQILVITCTYKPLELLEICKKIEVKLGRKKTFRYGPREIDLDILSYRDEQMDTENLTLPHPALKTRPYIIDLIKTLN